MAEGLSRAGKRDFVQLGFDGPGFPELVNGSAANPGEIDPQLVQAIGELGVEIEATFSSENGIDPVIVEAFARLEPRDFLAFGREHLNARGITSDGRPHVRYGRW